jgi:hypothetical protein
METIETTIGDLVAALTDVVSEEPTGRTFQMEMVSLALENMVRRSSDLARFVQAIEEI